ncbi:IS4 family transposase [Alteromonadaceae bacterium 2753L.S.0a.02]|nr:IS4 family transposase [Alteromonadaceae bacterium 2753L.S.0a.02]
MSNYLDDNLNQSVFLDVNFLDVLGENTFEFCLYTLVTHTLSLEQFDRCYRNTSVGRKAYPPALLLRVIFYAYYRGMTSSRSIERACKTDLTFMALASGRAPHFTTIADFVSSHDEAMKSLFHKVLMICCKSGLVGKEHFAIDGCKLPSDASKQWSGKHADLKRKSQKLRKSAQEIIDRHLSNDGGSGDDKAKHTQTVDTLLANADKIDEFLTHNEKRLGSGKHKREVQSNITDNESCKMDTSGGTIQGYNCQTVSDELYQIVIANECFGVGQDQSLLQPMVEAIKNSLGEEVFDDGVLLTADTGYSSEANMKYLFDQNINAVVPDTLYRQRDPRIANSENVKKHKDHRQKTRKDQRKTYAKIPASDFSFNKESLICVCPNGHEMMYHGDHFEINGRRYHRFKSYLKNCRACSIQSKCMKKPLKEHGRQVSFRVDGEDNHNYLDLMKQKIDSEQGRADYARRMWTIEPVFGNITSNKGINKLTLRGKAKVTCQWMMCCIMHNIEKLWRYGDISIMGA